MIRGKMEPDLVSLLDELKLFDRMTYDNETLGEAFYRIGIKTITILAGRNAGGGGGIQPQKLEKERRRHLRDCVDAVAHAKFARKQRKTDERESARAATGGHGSGTRKNYSDWVGDFGPPHTRNWRSAGDTTGA